MGTWLSKLIHHKPTFSSNIHIFPHLFWLAAFLRPNVKHRETSEHSSQWEWNPPCKEPGWHPSGRRRGGPFFGGGKNGWFFSKGFFWGVGGERIFREILYLKTKHPKNMASWGMPCFFVSLKLCLEKKHWNVYVPKKWNQMFESSLTLSKTLLPPPPSLSSRNKHIISIFRCIPLTSRFSERPATIRSERPRDTGIPNWHLPTSRPTGAVPHIASGSTAPCGYQMQHLSFFWDVAGWEEDSSKLRISILWKRRSWQICVGTEKNIEKNNWLIFTDILLQLFLGKILNIPLHNTGQKKNNFQHSKRQYFQQLANRLFFESQPAVLSLTNSSYPNPPSTTALKVLAVNSSCSVWIILVNHGCVKL